MWMLALLAMAGVARAHEADHTIAEQAASRARDFLAGLTPEQQALAARPLDDPQRTDWHYVPKGQRKGLALGAMAEAQQAAAFALMRTVLSAAGYSRARTIMSLEEILRAVEKRPQVRDPLKYHWTVFGTPAAGGKWGLSIEGHHLSLNFAFDDGHVASVTPMFFGANPSEVRRDVGAGPPVGTRPLESEEELGFALLRSLTDDQRRRAIVSDKSPSDMNEAAKAQTSIGEPVGLDVADMTDEQRAIAARLVAAYIRKAPAPVAKDHLHAAVKELEQARFAWFGATEAGAPHSYRVQSPAFLFLLFNSQNDVDRNPANHVHTLWRMIGRDFAEIAQHQHPHAE
jgi:hypothetical protein